MPSTFDNTPNTGLPFQVLTSYSSDIFADAGALHAGGSAGYGTLEMRDVATEVAMYKPYSNALDTIIQLTGGFEVATSSVHEWIEDDELLDDEALGDTNTDATVINSGNGTPTYTAANTGNFIIADTDAPIFVVGDVVRYVTSAGAYQYALITDIPAAVSNQVYLALQAWGSGTLPAATATAKIQRLQSLRGSDLNFAVEPRSSLPKMYYTYIQKLVNDARFGARVQNEQHYIDLIMEIENKLFAELRRSREIQALYGYKGIITLSNGDSVYGSPGLYDSIASFNKSTASLTTSGSFDATKFTEAMYSFIEHNFGGESGGPDTRTMFIDARFASFLSQAFEGSKRFQTQEYIAGVRVMRWEHNLGNVDFVYLPIFSYKHPIPDGSIRESNPKAVGMLCPVQECVTRLVMKGEGPRSQTFIEKGGDVEQNMRVQTTEGLKLRLKEYCAVFEEL